MGCKRRIVEPDARRRATTTARRLRRSDELCAGRDGAVGGGGRVGDLERHADVPGQPPAHLHLVDVRGVRRVGQLQGRPPAGRSATSVEGRA
jgi:hypothetical protein